MSNMEKSLHLNRNSHNLYQDIIGQGYSELKNSGLTKLFYQKLYSAFDSVIKIISQTPQLKTTLDNTETDFLAHYKNVYSGAPAGYRNCHQKIGKKDQKIYFQFNQEYYLLLRKNYSDILQKFTLMELFLKYFNKVDEISKQIFYNAINKLDQKIPNFKKIIFGKREDLTVIIKLLRYDRNGKLCTSPHYDKSALTLALDNDDRTNNKLIIAPYMKNFEINNLKAPNRKFEGSKQYTSTLLFPGACLEKAGIQLKPTPHAVLPSERDYRHALIAFCLIPNLDTSNIQTTIVDKNQIIGMI